MNVTDIIFKNFRNIDFKHIKAEKINIIYGKNARGKTNVVEGVFTLLNGHSFKRSNVVIQKYNTQETLIKGIVNNKTVEIIINKKGKTIKVESKKTNIMTLKEHFPSIIYSIDSLLSFKDKDYLFSLIDRNSFVKNREIANYLIEYKKTIKLKKNILTNTDNPDEEMLRVVNKKLYEIMNEIGKRREESVKYLNDNINDILKKFTDKRVKIEYKRQNLQKDVARLEIIKKRVLNSLNRDSLNILFDGKNVFNYSSVGEKKIILFSLVVTIVLHYNIYKTPVVLVDDIEGDLDRDYRNIVFETLIYLPNQLFLTTLGEYLYNDANIIRL